MPPEPPGLTVYFSDILKEQVVNSLVVNVEHGPREKRVTFGARSEYLMFRILHIGAL